MFTFTWQIQYGDNWKLQLILAITNKMKILNLTWELEDHSLADYMLGYFSFLQLSDEQIRDYEENFEGEFRKVQAFYQVKATLAPCIEALILLDRLAFLQQQVR